jgi:protocatechuate 3,4-dioxygenase alpha subunit
VTDGSDRAIATPSQTVGPFFQVFLTQGSSIGTLASDDTRGERLRLRVHVLDGDGAPVPDCIIEIYQANADGEYGHRSFSGFGRLGTDAQGRCVFDTIRPGRVPDGHGGTQASRVDVCLFARGLLRHLYTRIYFNGDPDLARDPLLALLPPERRETLMAVEVEPADAGRPSLWEQVIRLQGERETVFLDL